ncbi:MAG: CheR family methyltransferase, partial [Bacteroidales bacterium]
TTRLYGFDLRIFAATTLMRRISAFMAEQNLKDVDNLAARLENDKSFFPVFQKQLIVPCTELFRDPAFWRSFRDDVIPLLENQTDKIKIWVPGCSSGEEAISTVLMFHEKNLHNQT